MNGTRFWNFRRLLVFVAVSVAVVVVVSSLSTSIETVGAASPAGTPAPSTSKTNRPIAGTSSSSTVQTLPVWPTLANIHLTEGSWGQLQYDPALGNVYVPGPDSVSVINPTLNKWVGSIVLPEASPAPEPINSMGAAYDSANEFLYITGGASSLQSGPSMGSDPAEEWYQPSVWAIEPNQTVVGFPVMPPLAPPTGMTSAGSSRIGYDPVNEQIYYDFSSQELPSGETCQLGWANGTAYISYEADPGQCAALDPFSLVANPWTGDIYELNESDSDLSIIDPSTDSHIGFLDLPADDSPGTGAFNTRDRLFEVPVYNSSSEQYDLLAFNVTSQRVVHTVPVGDGAGVALYDPIRQRIYVSNYASNTVTVVNAVNYQPMATFSVSGGPEGMTLDPVTGSVYVADYSTENVSVLCGASVYSVTFSETGLESPSTWSASFNGSLQSAAAGSSITYYSCGNGSFSYSIPHVWGYTSSPTTGTVTVNGASVTVKVVFTSHDQAYPYSQFHTDFLQNFSFEDTIGLITADGNLTPSRVYAEWGKTQFNLTGGSLTTPYNATINVGNLASGHTLSFFAVYGKTTLEKNLSFVVVSLPGWLETFTSLTHDFSFNDTPTHEWNNTYSMTASAAFSLAQGLQFNANLALVDGNLSLVPNVAFEFTFQSTGTLTFSGSASGQAPSIVLVGENVTVSFSVVLAGKVAVNTTTDSIVWQKSTLNVTVGGQVSIGIPIYSVGIPGTPWDVGLWANVSLGSQIGLDFNVTPTGPSTETFPPFPFKLTLETIAVLLSLGIELTAGINDVATVGGGGSITAAVNLSASPPAVKNATISGTINAQACLFSGCIGWSYNVGSVSLGPRIDNPRVLAASSTYNSSILPRYYNTSSYEKLAWTTGNYSGTAMDNFYPLATWSAAAGWNGTTYLVSARDNVSRPVTKGLSLEGLVYNSSTRAFSTWSQPSTSGYAVTHPVVAALSNGELAEFWTAAPFTKVNESNPFTLTALDLRTADFTPATQSWSSPKNWSTWGFPVSYAVSTNGSSNAMLVLYAHSPFGTSGSLVEYNLSSGAVLANITVSGIESIGSFSDGPSLASLTTYPGGYELLNVSKDQVVSLPTPTGYTLDTIEPVVGESAVFALLDASNRSDLIQLFDGSNGTVATTVTLTPGVSFAAAAEVDGQTVLLAQRGLQSTVGTLTGDTDTPYTSVDLTGSVAITPIFSAGTLQIYGTKISGSSATPTKSLCLSEVPLMPPSAPSITIEDGHGPNLEIKWSLKNSALYGVTGYELWASTSKNASSFEEIDQFASSTTKTYVALPAPGVRYFAMTATNVFGLGALGKSAGVGSVVFATQGPTGNGTWGVTFAGVEVNVTGNTVVFADPFGTSSFTVSPPSSLKAYPASGSIAVGATVFYQTFRFAASAQTVEEVTFNETGLSKGTVWSVSLNGTLQSSNTSSLSFYEPAGTYAYVVTAISGKTASPAQGNVTVTTSTVLVKITFAKASSLVGVVPSEGPVSPPLLGRWLPD